MENEIHRTRESRRPRDKIPSGMTISNEYNESYFDPKSGEWRNWFDKEYYAYYEDMKQPRASIKRDRIAMHIADEYRQAYKGTHQKTVEKVYGIIRWLSKNTDFILVLMSDQDDYPEIRKIYKRLSEMEVAHLYQGFTSGYKDPTVPTVHHRTGIFLTALSLDRFKVKPSRVRKAK